MWSLIGLKKCYKYKGLLLGITLKLKSWNLSNNCEAVLYVFNDFISHYPEYATQKDVDNVNEWIKDIYSIGETIEDYNFPFSAEMYENDIEQAVSNFEMLNIQNEILLKWREYEEKNNILMKLISDKK